MAPDFPNEPLSAHAQRRLTIATNRRYRLERDEDVAQGVRRIARGRGQTAVEHLRGDGDPTAAVHEARKDLKKLRSLLRLVRNDLGDDVYRAENERYRDAGRRLSGPRDAEVKLATISAIREKYAGEAPAMETLERSLEDEHERLAADGGELRVRMEEAAAAIEAGAPAIDEWELRAEGFELVAPGLRRAYARGRRAYRAVRDEPGHEAVHEWRKRVKDLWYQTRLVRDAWDGPLKAMADEAHDLADLLGDHNDLAVLVEDAQDRGDADADELANIARRRQAELLREALLLGGRIYTEKPGRLIDRLDAYLDAWRAPEGATV
jgi:CHAD domain-containing protein